MIAPLGSATPAKSGLFSSPSNRRSRLAAFAALCVVAWVPIAWGAARLLIVNQPLAHADAIAVLSGAAAYKERTRYAAELFKGGYGQRIIVTNDNYRGGWSPAEERNPYYYELEVAELRRAGIPDDKIVVMLEPVGGTSDEAVLFRRYAETEGVRSILVVTSAYHSRRALWTLRKAFEGSNIAIGLEPVPTGAQTPSPISWWLRVRGWRTVPVEYVKIVYYWLQFR